MMIWEELNLENYNNYINNIINNRGQWTIPKDTYYEVHHIILRSFGGEPQKITHKTKHENLVWLTLPEHFEAHRILALDNLNNYKIVFAFMHLSTRKNGEIIKTAEEYEKIRAAFIKLDSEINTGKPSSMKGKHFNNEVKKKVSERTKLALANPEIKLKMSIENSGRTPWNKGKKTSEETKAKQSVKKLGKQLSPTHKQHISEGLLGRVVSNETRKKIADAQSDENCTHNVQIYCVETRLTYYSVKYAAEQLNCNGSNIIQVCRGKRKTANGYHFKYAEIREK